VACVLILVLGALFYQYWILKENYAQLSGDFQSLYSEYSYLRTQFNDLQSDYSALNYLYEDTIEKYDSLQLKYDKLQTDYDALKLQYETLQQQVIQSSSKESKKSDGRYLGQNYITPNDNVVIVLMQQITGGWSNDNQEQWNDVKRLYDWVVNNIAYEHDPEDHWKYPAETVMSGCGDCEDMAFLLTSMIMSYSNNAVWAISICANNEGHKAVILPVKGFYVAVLDPAGHYYTSDAFGSLVTKDFSTEIYNWLAFWNKQHPGARVSNVFTDKACQEFTCTEDFIQWARLMMSGSG